MYNTDLVNERHESGQTTSGRLLDPGGGRTGVERKEDSKVIKSG